jgi:hypothetical protein
MVRGPKWYDIIKIDFKCPHCVPDCNMCHRKVREGVDCLCHKAAVFRDEIKVTASAVQMLGLVTDAGNCQDCYEPCFL